jgi:RNA polymerase sigma-70 factor (ECF subfamily)
VDQSTDCVTGTEPSAATDLDLVRLAQAGDVDAFGELVERNRRAVFRAALACVRSPAEADDVAQEAFVTAYRKLGTFRGDAQFRTWLLSITWPSIAVKASRGGFAWP